jgi:hypothetical protein
MGARGANGGVARGAMFDSGRAEIDRDIGVRVAAGMGALNRETGVMGGMRRPKRGDWRDDMNTMGDGRYGIPTEGMGHGRRRRGIDVGPEDVEMDPRKFSSKF